MKTELSAAVREPGANSDGGGPAAHGLCRDSGALMANSNTDMQKPQGYSRESHVPRGIREGCAGTGMDQGMAHIPARIISGLVMLN